jgi:hypothetical protein
MLFAAPVGFIRAAPKASNQERNRASLRGERCLTKRIGPIGAHDLTEYAEFIIGRAFARPVGYSTLWAADKSLLRGAAISNGGTPPRAKVISQSHLK